MLLFNLALALAWLALTGQFNAENFVFGFLLGMLILWGTQLVSGQPYYLRKVTRLLAFLLFFLRKLLAANLRIAWLVLKPRLDMRPAIVAVPIDPISELEITLLTSMITLTPGSLVLDVSRDKRTLYVHAIDVSDLESYREEVKEFEYRLQGLFA